MTAFSARTTLIFAIDIALLVLCSFNIRPVALRARVPFEVVDQHDAVMVSRLIDSTAAASLRAGDRVLQIEGNPISLVDALEFIGDRGVIGDRIGLLFRRAETDAATTVTLIPYYESSRFITVMFIVGLIAWLLGMFVGLARAQTRAVVLLHWACIALAVTFFTTWGAIDRTSLVSLSLRVLFFVAYTFGAAIFFVFTLVYPRQKVESVRTWSALAAGAAFVVSAGQTWTHLSAIVNNSIEEYEAFAPWFSAFNVFLFVCVVAGVFSFAHTYRTSPSSEDRKRLNWILWGSVVAWTPFLMFIKLPQLAGFPTGLIPEEYATIFFLVMPLAFGLSVLRHELTAVRIVVKRSLIYGSVTAFMGVAYFLAAMLATELLGVRLRVQEYVLIAAVTLLIGILLNPVRKHAQALLDELLFPARAQFRSAVAAIRNELQSTPDTNEVFRVLAEAVQRVLVVDGLIVYQYIRGKLHQRYPTTLANVVHEIGEEELRALAQSRILSTGKGIFVQRADVISDPGGLLRRLGCSIVVPIAVETEEVLAVVALNISAAHDALREEEVDLLRALCVEAAQTLRRLALQKQVILEQEEKHRLEELSKLKSYFVSGVSHELRTPLTSIRLFAESLQTAKGLSRKTQREYLRIIEGEAARLTRLIDNVLDFSRVERGVKEYTFREVPIAHLIRHSVSTMRYQVAAHRATLSVRLAKQLPPLIVDPDAIEEVLLNLLSNALKYSGTKKRIRLAARRRKDVVEIDVSDTGIGIPESEQGKIFDPFYRVRKEGVAQHGGAGLGLALSKAIIEAHGGVISLRSVLHRGTTITVSLPIHSKVSNL